MDKKNQTLVLGNIEVTCAQYLDSIQTAVDICIAVRLKKKLTGYCAFFNFGFFLM